MRIHLRTINMFLRRLGFVLVVEFDEDVEGCRWTAFRFERVPRWPLR